MTLWILRYVTSKLGTIQDYMHVPVVSFSYFVQGAKRNLLDDIGLTSIKVLTMAKTIGLLTNKRHTVNVSLTTKNLRKRQTSEQYPEEYHLSEENTLEIVRLCV